MKKNILSTLLLICLSLLFFTYSFEFEWLSLDKPMIYGGDGWWLLAVIKSVIENGWIYVTPNLGAPFGSVTYDFPTIDSAFWVLIKVLSLFTVNASIVLNLFLICSFVFTPVVTFYVCLDLALTRFYSILVALLFNVLPFHFLRMEHPFLGFYYIIPLSIWLGLKLTDNWQINTSKRKLLVCIISILAGCSGAYYFLYSALTWFVLSMRWLADKGNFRRWCTTWFVPLAIASSVFVLQVLPSVLYSMKNGKNTEVQSRWWVEAEVYGLRIPQLLLPSQNHRVAKLADMGGNYNRNAPQINENITAAIGIAGSVGFCLLLIGLIFVVKKITVVPQFNSLWVLLLSYLAFAIPGGVGTFLAIFVTASFRANNRISTWVAFVCVLFFAHVLQSVFKEFRYSKKIHYLLLGLIFLLSIFDVIPVNLTKHAVSAAQFDMDRLYFSELDRQYPNKLIYQYPFIGFPEVAPLSRENYNQYMVPYLHTNSLSWSYGAIKGRSESRFLQEVGQLRVEEQLATLKVLGFDMLLIMRQAQADNGVAIESTLKLLGAQKPMENNQSTYALYSLENLNTPPVQLENLVHLGTGFSQWEAQDSALWSWAKKYSELIIWYPKNEVLSKWQISFDIKTKSELNLQIYFGEELVYEKPLVGDQQIKVELPLPLVPGKNLLRFKARRGFYLKSAQSKIIFGISNIRLAK